GIPVVTRVVIGHRFYRSPERRVKLPPGKALRLDRWRGGPYSRGMLRQFVWYPDGSPAATVASGLPAGFEARPLSQAGGMRRRLDDPEAVVVDLDHDTPEALSGLSGKVAGAPVIAMVSAGARVDGWPKTCY